MDLKKGYFYNHLTESRQDNGSLKTCMEETVVKMLDSDTSLKKPGVLLGKIQSGKTRAFLGVIALAFDNDYDIAIILTKGTKALAEQTYARLNRDFKKFVDDHKMQIFDIMHVPENLISWELNQKIVMVVKKEKNNLNRTFRALMETYPNLKNKKVLMIDDEADLASISYHKDGETGEIEQGTIGRMIDGLRTEVADSDFLQVTATPYSLYLQPDSTLPESGFHFLPKKPEFTVLLPVHNQYIGGDFYFQENLNTSDIGYYIFEEIPVEEMDALKKPDGRRFTLDQVLDTRAIIMLRKAVTNFVVGACIRQLQQISNEEPETHYSFIIHTERGRSSHDWQVQVVESIITNFKRIAIEDSDKFEALIDESYKDLQPSINAGGFPLPTFEEVIIKVKEAVREERILTAKVNSEIEVKQLLDESGQLKLRTPLNIFVGGQILDRGITVQNLIGFYYGRNPKKFQQDTVLQHSRMYGTRSKEDLSVTRFYTTRNIYEIMRRIDEFDNALREAFLNGSHDQGVYFLRKDASNRLAPCSPNKLLPSTITTIRPLKRLLPIGFQTGYKSNIKRIVENLDGKIIGWREKFSNNPIMVSVDEAISVLDEINKLFVYEDDGYEWDLKAHKASLEYLSLNSTSASNKGKVFVVVRENMSLSRQRPDGRFSNDPIGGGVGAARNEAIDLAIDTPVLILIRENGKEADGWRDSPFWWPVIMPQQNIPISIFASDTIDKED
jgi:hypothetical protein